MKAELLSFALFALACRASAHDLGCNGLPVPESVKQNCCGKSDHHLVAPEAVGINRDGDWTVVQEGETHVFTDSETALSPDGCYHVWWRRDINRVIHWACFEAPRGV